MMVDMTHMRYVGRDFPDLVGKTALVRPMNGKWQSNGDGYMMQSPTKDGWLMAQFDDREATLLCPDGVLRLAGYGWYGFAEQDFEEVKDEDTSGGGTSETLLLHGGRVDAGRSDEARVRDSGVRGDGRGPPDLHSGLSLTQETAGIALAEQVLDALRANSKEYRAAFFKRLNKDRTR